MSRCLSAYGVTRNDTFSVSYGYGLFTGGLAHIMGVWRIWGDCYPGFYQKIRKSMSVDS